jgi:hypothetical protein
MTRLTLLASLLAIGGLVAATPSVYAQAEASAAQQQTQEEHHPAGDQPADANAQAAQMMSMQQKMTMGMQQKMMSDMKAMDATLDALVTKMNAAKGDAKVDAIAELVTAVVRQRATMHDGMMQMHGQMMKMMMPGRGGQ